jgi:arylsulfatase
MPQKSRAALRFRRFGFVRLSLVALFLACAAPESEPRLNLVVVNVDTLRADHLPFHGYARDTAPFLSGLAQQSLVFEVARANSSFTRESVASLLTGRLPSRVGRSGWNAAPLVGNHLGPLLQQAGYRTAFLSNTVMLKHPGFSQGFDLVQHLPARWDLSGAGPKLTARALAFLDAGAEPFGLYLHYLDPHAPYAPSAERLARIGARPAPEPLSLYDEVLPRLASLVDAGFGPGEARYENLVSRYDAEIGEVDAALAALFAGLEARGLSERTLVVVTADHGEEFLEHGYLEHGWTLYEEVLRVPLLLWAPRHLAAARVSAPVSQIDLLPTLATLLDLPADGDDFDGAPLVERGEGAWRAAPPARPQIAELLIARRSVLRSVVEDGWKYVAIHRDVPAEAREARDAAGPSEEPWPRVPVREQLFQLEVDPEEQRDVLAQYPERAAALARSLPTLPVQTSTSPAPEPAAPLSEAERERLRQLGYL